MKIKRILDRKKKKMLDMSIDGSSTILRLYFTLLDQ